MRRIDTENLSAEEKLDFLNERLRKTVLKHKIALKFAQIGTVLTFVGLCVFVSSIGASSKCDKLLKEAGYNEFNEQYKQQQVEMIEERVYSRAIAPADYETEISKIQNFDKQEYLSNYCDETAQINYEKYSKLESTISNTGLTITFTAAGTTAITTVAVLSTAEKKYKEIEDELENMKNQLAK